MLKIERLKAEIYKAKAETLKPEMLKSFKAEIERAESRN